MAAIVSASSVVGRPMSRDRASRSPGASQQPSATTGTRSPDAGRSPKTAPTTRPTSTYLPQSRDLTPDHGRRTIQASSVGRHAEPGVRRPDLGHRLSCQNNMTASGRGRRPPMGAKRSRTTAADGRQSRTERDRQICARSDVAGVVPFKPRASDGSRHWMGLQTLSHRRLRQSELRHLCNADGPPGGAGRAQPAISGRGRAT
jgi:hypothetical protein